MSRRIRVAIAILLLVSLAVAGCMAHDRPVAGSTTAQTSTTPPPSSLTGPCAAGYYVGCDNNPDAHEMLNRFGFHQISNITVYPWPSHPEVDSGLVAWMEGGAGTPQVDHGFSIPLQKPHRFPVSKDQASIGLHPHGCCILEELVPQPGEPKDYANATLWTWDVATGAGRKLSAPPGPYLTAEGVGGFDGTWVLVATKAPDYNHTDGAAAINVNDGRFRSLVDVAPRGRDVHGAHLFFRSMANGSAFLSFYYDNQLGATTSTIEETNLETGAHRVLLSTSGDAIDGLDASDRYVVASAALHGIPGVWVMSRNNSTWWNVQKVPGAYGIDPVVNGDWCVYYEKNPGSKTWPGGLVGIYLPTGKRYELAPNPNGLGYASWATDGKYLVAEIQLDSFTAGTPPYQYQQDAAYPGSNIYWKDLPAPL